MRIYADRNAIIFASAIVLLFFGGCASGEATLQDCYSQSRIRQLSLPSFTLYVMNVKNVRAGTGSRVDLYTQLPYDRLRFERKAGGYTASYAMTYLFRNSAGEIVSSKEADRSIVVQQYEETIAQRFDFVLQSFTVPPGRYTVEVISTDNVSQLRYRTTETVAVDSFTGPGISASSVLFLDTILSDERGKSLRPILPGHISLLRDSVGMFQEVYGMSAGESISVRMEYLQHPPVETSDGSFLYFNPPYRVGSDDCKKEFDRVVYRHDSTIVAERSGTIQLFQFYPLPPIGTTAIRRTITVSTGETVDSVQIHHSVHRRDWRYHSTPTDDEILASLRYIVREKEYDSLTAVHGEARRRKIRQFWEARDGLGRQQEFERRIAAANTLFSSCLPGSSTPMGIAFIVCGPPDYVECRGPYYETWFYHLGDRAFSIQFRRENDQFPYYEMIPFSVNETLWQYYIDQWRKK